MSVQEYTLRRDRVERVMHLREKVNFAQLASDMSTPERQIDPRQFYRWLNGEHQIKANDLGKLADVLGVPMDYLIGRSETLEPSESGLDDTELELLALIRQGKSEEALELVLFLIRQERKAGAT